MMFWQSSLEHLAMWPPRHRCGCQAGLRPRTRRHHLRPLGALARDPTSRFAAALISPRTWREFRIEGDRPRLCSSDRDHQRLACGRSLLSQPRHVPGLFFYSVHISAGGKKANEPLGVAAPAARLTSCLMRVDWPAQPYRNLAQRLFQSYFIKCFDRASSLESAEPVGAPKRPANAVFELLSVASVKDCL